MDRPRAAADTVNQQEIPLNADTAITLGQNALTAILMVSGPLLLAGLVVGLLIGVFQTVTSIQESTLTYIPKMVAVIAAFVICMPWIARTMLSYSAGLFINLPTYAK